MLLLLAGVSVSAVVNGQRIEDEDLARRISAVAFDPTTFFRNEYGLPSLIRIAHVDHFRRPIYSISIEDGCLEGEAWSDACLSRLTARMVRAPAPPSMRNERDRSIHLARQLVQRRATTRAAIRSQLASLRLEWMEADLTSCPGIRETLARAANLNWVPEEITGPPLPNGDVRIYLDTDSVQVAFDTGFITSTFEGVPTQGSPGSWATELAAALEPCWRPARTAPPWNR